MPVCFSLTRKGKKFPESLHTVDEAICKHLKIPVDRDLWAGDWYNNIGMMLATGMAFNAILESFQKRLQEAPDNAKLQQRIAIVRFLEANYTSYAWREWN